MAAPPSTISPLASGGRACGTAAALRLARRARRDRNADAAAGGRPAAAMVHVNVGTGNAATAIISASRANVPVLMTAGRTPITEEGLPGSRDLHIHWAQESFDQAAMLREYVKWDYELRTAGQLQSVVDRALEVMLAEPRGPVYLT